MDMLSLPHREEDCGNCWCTFQFSLECDSISKQPFPKKIGGTGETTEFPHISQYQSPLHFFGDGSRFVEIVYATSQNA